MLAEDLLTVCAAIRQASGWSSQVGMSRSLSIGYLPAVHTAGIHHGMCPTVWLAEGVARAGAAGKMTSLIIYMYLFAVIRFVWRLLVLSMCWGVNDTVGDICNNCHNHMGWQIGFYETKHLLHITRTFNNNHFSLILIMFSILKLSFKSSHVYDNNEYRG